MKVLSIGNSFSQDAHKWLQKLAEQNGVDMQTVNLYIGGCSLQTHWKNVTENNPYYDLEYNGNPPERKISIEEALKMDNWDIITLQQVSNESGIFECYEPYLSSLADVVRKAQPNAKLYFHQTWAYETDSTHGAFVNYNNDQNFMYESILKASKKAGQTIDAAIIPTGEVIQTLRENVAEFDYQNGGKSLCRDGFHLTLDYGRYAAAAIWVRTLTDKKIECKPFENFDTQILEKICNVVNNI